MNQIIISRSIKALAIIVLTITICLLTGLFLFHEREFFSSFHPKHPNVVLWAVASSIIIIIYCLLNNFISEIFRSVWVYLSLAIIYFFYFFFYDSMLILTFVLLPFNFLICLCLEALNRSFLIIFFADLLALSLNVILFFNKFEVLRELFGIPMSVANNISALAYFGIFHGFYVLFGGRSVNKNKSTDSSTF